MKNLIFTSFIICFVWQVNAQTEFAPLKAEWYYTYAVGCCPEEHFNHVVSEKDTIVGENNCRILRQYYDNSNTANGKYVIKHEQGKVYYYYQNQFNLLFDFDAEVNDIVEFTFMYKKDDNDFPLGKDTLFSAKYRVESITTNAQNLRIFTTRVLEEEEEAVVLSGIVDFPYTYTYTEKIGFQELLGSQAYREFIPVFDNRAYPDIEIYRWLRCYSDTDLSFVSEKWAAKSLPCDYPITTGINSIKDENIAIYPNPFSDNIFVFSNGGNIEIINISGKVVYCSELLYGINEIAMSHFLKGMYMVKIQNKDSIQILKIVKL